jgi:hypothetical protein
MELIGCKRMVIVIHLHSSLINWIVQVYINALHKFDACALWQHLKENPALICGAKINLEKEKPHPLYCTAFFTVHGSML